MKRTAVQREIVDDINKYVQIGRNKLGNIRQNVWCLTRKPTWHPRKNILMELLHEADLALVAALNLWNMAEEAPEYLLVQIDRLDADIGLSRETIEALLGHPVKRLYDEISS
jgi:hypothetical protein